MTNEEFEIRFRELTVTFRLKATADEAKAVQDAYYRIFKDVSTGRFEAASERWLREGKYFPKPAELLERLPAASAGGEIHFVPDPDQPGRYRRTICEWPWLTKAHVDEYHRAERQGWEDPPCGCPDCRTAGVDHKPIRYVPEFTSDDICKKGKDPATGLFVYAGHWAHGAELVRWYVARDDFYAKFRAWATGPGIRGEAPRGKGWTSMKTLAADAGHPKPLVPPPAKGVVHV